jgi:hypothetical protein
MVKIIETKNFQREQYLINNRNTLIKILNTYLPKNFYAKTDNIVQIFIYRKVFIFNNYINIYAEMEKDNIISLIVYNKKYLNMIKELVKRIEDGTNFKVKIIKDVERITPFY